MNNMGLKPREEINLLIKADDARRAVRQDIAALLNREDENGTDFETIVEVYFYALESGLKTLTEFEFKRLASLLGQTMRLIAERRGVAFDPFSLSE